MRLRVVLAAGLLGVLLALCAALIARGDGREQGGPLGGGSDAGIVVDAFSAGSEITYGLQNLTNSGPDEIVIDGVDVLLGEPGLEVVDDVLAYGPSRLETFGYNTFDVQEGWPPTGDAAPLVGASIAPFDRIGLEVLVGVRVPSLGDGVGTLDGVRVAYTAGGRQYVRTFHLAMTLCAHERAHACDSAVPKPPKG